MWAGVFVFLESAPESYFQDNNNVIYYDVAPNYHFGVWDDPISKTMYRRAIEDNGFQTYIVYKGFCIDIDGFNKGEAPFGYGIRIDGKILNGLKADEWLNKAIHEK